MRLIDADAIRYDRTEGHWVHGKELSRDYIGGVCVRVHYDKYWCSECYYPVEGQPLWKYCPNCGAKMDEDRDYEHAFEQLEHNMTFEPTYNPEDGSM